MQFKYRVPEWWPKVDDWLNKEIWWKVRWVDILTVVFGVICIVYYGLTFEVWWHGALLGFIGYAVVVMTASMLRKP